MTTFETRHHHRTYDDREFKVVPKDAVVLDPAKSPEPLNDAFAATFLDSAAEIIEKKVKRRRVREVPFLRWLANEISAQTKPRIPQPSRWGVVEASTATDDARRQFGRTTVFGDAQWFDGYVFVPWDDLIDPVLVRAGIEDES